MAKSKRRLIKQAKIGDVWFNVFVDPDMSNAEYKFDWHPEHNNRMYLGLAGLADYAEAYERLLHETVEIALEIRGGANYITNHPRDYAAYKRFAFSHEDFQYAMQEAAQFLMVVTPIWEREVRKRYPKLPRLKGEAPK